jgi:hypothetical protein
MNHPNEEPIQTSLDGISGDLRPFAAKVLQAMNAAVDAGNKRLHGQLAKIFAAISPLDAVEVWPFWAAESKALAAEWNDLRTATIQAQADQQAEVHSDETQDQTARTDTEETAPQEAAEPVQESQPEAAQNPTEESVKPKREYRKIEYVAGQNPFRPGSKNANVWDLLVEGGHTAEAIAEATGADLKSVNYLVWLARRGGIEIQKTPETKTLKLVGPVPTA